MCEGFDELGRDLFKRKNSEFWKGAVTESSWFQNTESPAEYTSGAGQAAHLSDRGHSHRLPPLADGNSIEL